MERALVVVDDTEESRELLRKAGEIATGVGAELYLFSSLDPEAFDEEVATLDAIGEVEHTSYSDEDALQSVHADIEDTVDDVFDGEPGFAYETIGVVTQPNKRASMITDAAEKYDCEHIFLSGRKRSPTGKALFGDTVQSVLLNFDGEVTVSLQ